MWSIGFKVSEKDSNWELSSIHNANEDIRPGGTLVQLCVKRVLQHYKKRVRLENNVVFSVGLASPTKMLIESLCDGVVVISCEDIMIAVGSRVICVPRLGPRIVHGSTKSSSKRP